MDRRLKRLFAVAALVLACGALLLVSVLQPVVGTRTDFSIYNTRWNGASSFAADVYRTGGLVPTFSLSLAQEDVEVAHRSFAEFGIAPAQGSLVVVGPDRGLTAREADWLRDFVASGGRLLLADDFGTGNGFLEAAGATTRVEEGLVRDLAYSKRPEFVVTDRVTPHDLTDGVLEVVLDYPAGVTAPAPASPLAATRASSWIDRDGDQVHDVGEPSGPHTWLVLEPVGAGQVLVVGDPSLFINGLAGLGDNAALRANIVAWLTQGGRSVLVDESHRDYTDPVRLVGARLQDVPPAWRTGLAVAAAGLLLLLVHGRPRRLGRAGAFISERLHRLLVAETEPAPQPDLVARARARHPEWDEGVLRSILAEWRRTP